MVWKENQDIPKSTGRGGLEQEVVNEPDASVA